MKNIEIDKIDSFGAASSALLSDLNISLRIGSENTHTPTVQGIEIIAVTLSDRLHICTDRFLSPIVSVPFKSGIRE